jgi:hypothetical protein
VRSRAPQRWDGSAGVETGLILNCRFEAIRANVSLRSLWVFGCWAFALSISLSSLCGVRRSSASSVLGRLGSLARDWICGDCFIAALLSVFAFGLCRCGRRKLLLRKRQGNEPLEIVC